MATFRPFCYNPSPNPLIPGTEQVGDLAAGVNLSMINSQEWWSGPDEDLGFVIAYVDPSGDRPNAPERIFMTNYVCHIGFLRTNGKSDIEFIKLARIVLNNNNIVTALQAKSELNTNGFWTSWPGVIPSGMSLFLDAGDANSYSGSGNTWFDLSGYNNHGTMSGATFSPEFEGTMVFDGVNDSITFNNPVEIPIGNEPYTISVWFNSDEMPSDRGFVGWGAFGNVNQVNAWRLRNNGGNSGFRHYWWGNDLDYDVPMSTGTWYHAVAAYENGSRKLYLNNVQVAEDFPTGHNVPYSTNLRIGVTADFLGEWFDGKISQVIIYKRQATVDEIEAIWNSGKYRYGYGNTVTSGLVVNLDAGSTASYPGTGNLWTDLEGSNDATLINSPTYQTQFGGYLSFDDSSNEYATIPNIGDLNEWSVEVWFKLTTSLTGKVTSVVSNQFDLSSKLNFSIGTNNAPSNYNLSVGFFDGAWRTTTGIATTVGQWYHVVGTYDGTTIRQYVNGTASGGTVTYSGTPQSGGEIRIMRRWDSPVTSSNLVDGDLQVVRIYNRALTAIEVKQNYDVDSVRFI